MGDFAFGGPRGGIIQTAFVVEDIRESIASWVSDCHVGPWFLLDHFTGDHPVYRGAPSRADVAIAMAFAGHMQIELIQPNDNNPSVYKRQSTRAAMASTISAAPATISRPTSPRSKAAATPSPSAPACRPAATSLIWTSRDISGFLELISATSGMEEVFTRFWQASVGWDGSDPVRPFG